MAAESLQAAERSATEQPRIGARHRGYYLSGFFAAILLFAASAWLALQDKLISGWELAIFRHVNDLPDRLRVAGLAITITPESTLIGAAAVVLAFLLRKYQLCWRLALGVIGGSAAILVAKHLIGRERPSAVVSDVHLRAHDTGMGFPSGHTMIITVILLTALPYIPGKWKLLVPLPILAMGWSRVYLGLHAPLDIAGGFAIGLGVVCFLRILPGAVKRLARLKE